MKVADIRRIPARPGPVAPRELGALARAIVAEPVADAISPIVLVGIVRFIEFVGIAAIGAACYAALLYRTNQEFEWAYVGTIFLVSGAAVLAFQAFDTYHVAAFRSHVHQLSRIALAWS